MHEQRDLDADRSLLERESEMDALPGVVARVLDGSGRFVVFEGSPGLGKTRLLKVANALAGDAGMRVLTARGIQLERGLGFGVVRQLFDGLLNSAAESERLRLLAGTAGQASAVVGAHAVSDGGDVGAGDFAAIHGLYWLATNLSQQGPIAIIVDDLHWVDAASLRFLAHLLPRLDGLPILVVATTRPAEPGAAQSIIDLLMMDQQCTVMRLAPLSAAAAAVVVRAAVGGASDDAFDAACYQLTGGNPLLLRELATASALSGIPSTAAGAARLPSIGAAAIRRRVSAQLSALAPRATALARAVAVLDDGASIRDAAHVAGLASDEAGQALRELTSIEILRGREPLEFEHALVRVAVVDAIDSVELAGLHQRAAAVVADRHGPLELVAAHLLHTTPAGDQRVVETLRAAAASAVTNAAPASALTYLDRALAEPAAGPAQRHIIAQAGAVAQLVDWHRATEYLTDALRLADPADERGALIEMLGRSLFMTGRQRETVELYQEAISGLAGDPDLLQRLQASLINVTTAAPELHRIADTMVGRLRDVPTGSTVGGRMLDALISWHDAIVAVDREAAVQRTRRALHDGLLLRQANGSEALTDACWVLISADCADAVDVLSEGLAQAHHSGSTVAVAAARIFRTLAWLRRGELAEAQADAAASLRLIDEVSADIGRPFAAAFLADTLLEMGRVDAAQGALDWAHRAGRLLSTGQQCWLTASEARVMLARGEYAQAADAALACGAQFASYGWRNAAFLSWRPVAAVALQTLGRRAQALDLVEEELELARRWATPYVLGGALRLAGGMRGDAEGLALLEEAVAVLDGSIAELETAKALHDLGSALYRRGALAAARTHLARAYDLADRCGAAVLAEQVRTELRAAGARPRRSAISGTLSLTPSERRTAELAAQGHSNRDIAQRLFVTPKTVEVHLGSVYRKLSVGNRVQMARALTDS